VTVLFDQCATLMSLANAVKSAVVHSGFEAEKRDYFAHLTIGRVKHGRIDVLGDIASLRGESVKVNAVTLFESVDVGDGVKYEVLSCIPL